MIRVTYNLLESNLIMIPHPTVAKEKGIYNLCVGGIMIEPCMYYPIVSTDEIGGLNKIGFTLAKNMI